MKDILHKVSAAVEAYNNLKDGQKKIIRPALLEKLQSALEYPAQKQNVVLKSVKMKKGKKAVVKWEKNNMAEGYQLQYKAKGAKAKTIDVDGGATVKKVVKKLKAGKKYTIKIRTYVEIKDLATGAPEKVYGQWSNVKKAKAKK